MDKFNNFITEEDLDESRGASQKGALLRGILEPLASMENRATVATGLRQKADLSGLERAMSEAPRQALRDKATLLQQYQARKQMEQEALKTQRDEAARQGYGARLKASLGGAGFTGLANQIGDDATPETLPPFFEKMLQLEAQKRERANDFAQQKELYGLKAGLDRESELAKLREKQALISPQKRAYEALPDDKQMAINELSKKSANKASIANQIDSVVASLDDPNISQDQKLNQAKQLIKTLNSTEGADAVGAEEAKRLGSLLEFNVWPNLTNPGPVFGRAPISDFSEQAKLTSKAIRGAVKSNEGMVADLYGGGSMSAEPQMAQQPQQVAPDVAQRAREILAKRRAAKSGVANAK